MPTARGWLVAAAGIGLWAAARIFGVPPLSQLGFGLLALVIVAVVIVRLGKHEVEVSRTIAPERVSAGREVMVRLHLHNKGRGSAPLLLLEDHVPPELTGRARFAVRGIEAKGARITSFTLRPARRGRYKVGPVEISVMDPFGVARVRSEVAGTTEFLAYPRIEELIVPKDSGQKRSLTVSARRQPTGAHGEDFYTLRDYVEGDDLRRIHWPATAKRDRYMVRQEETPWHARATVVLDDRAAAHSPASWERAVEVCASVMDLYYRSSYSFRLVQALGPGVGSSRGADHFHSCLDLLAMAETSAADPSPDTVDPLLMTLAELERQPAIEGVLVAAVGTPTLEVAHALTRCSKRFRLVVAVLLDRDRYRMGARAAADEGDTLARILDRGGVKTLSLKPGDGLAMAWSALWRVWAAAPSQPVTISGEGGDSAWDPKRELA